MVEIVMEFVLDVGIGIVLWVVKFGMLLWLAYHLEEKCISMDYSRTLDLYEKDIQTVNASGGTEEGKALLRSRLYTSFRKVVGFKPTTSSSETVNEDGVFEEGNPIHNRYIRLESKDTFRPISLILMYGIFLALVIGMTQWSTDVDWTNLTQKTFFPFLLEQVAFLIGVVVLGFVGYWRFKQMTPWLTKEPLVLSNFLTKEELERLQRIQIEKEMDRSPEGDVLNTPIFAMNEAVVSFLSNVIVGEKKADRAKEWDGLREEMLRWQGEAIKQQAYRFESVAPPLSERTIVEKQTSVDMKRTLQMKAEVEEILNKETTSPEVRDLARKIVEQANSIYDEEEAEAERLRRQWQKEEDMATLIAARKHVGISETPKKE